MSKGKLEKFAEFDAFPNTFDYQQQTAGKWKEYFGNDHPLVLELACGKGDYSLGLAQLYPEKNFLGLDIKGNRLWKGAKTALEMPLKNVAFLRIAIDNIATYFEPGEVEEIWITFADPQPSKKRKRLTHPKFLNEYLKILGGSGVVNLKTDSELLYEFTQDVITLNELKVLQDLPNVYAIETPPVLQIQTYYEKMWLEEGRTIRFISFLLDKNTMY